MNKFSINTLYKIEELIELVKIKTDRHTTYAIYAAKGTGDLVVGMSVFVGDVPDFDENDNEVFPEIIEAQGLEFAYMRDHFQDVIDLACTQKPDATSKEFIRCLNYYSGYDDFLDLN